MLGAGGRTAAQESLHRESAHKQTFAELLRVGNVAGVYLGRGGEGFLQPILDEMPGEVVDLLIACSVGQHPVGGGRNLGYEVCIAGSGELLRGLCRNLRVHHEAVRGRAVVGLLVAVLCDGGAVGSVSVHGNGGTHAHILASKPAGNQFGEVVYDARAHGNGNHIPVLEEILYHFNETPFGIELRIVNDEFFRHRDSGFLQRGLHGLSGHLPGVGVRDDHRGLSREELVEHFRRAGYHSLSYEKGLCVSGALESAFNLVHYFQQLSVLFLCLSAASRIRRECRRR